MRKKEKIQFIQDTLEKLYPDPVIPLDHINTYTFLIAVLLSAQCTDKKVNQVTPELFKKADNPKKMLTLSLDEIENIIRPCGLGPKKSRAIYELSKILCEEYQQVVPKTLQELEKLPGVGHKTASVVVSQAFNTPAFPVDTHIHRAAKRWGLSNGKNVSQTEKDLKKCFPKEKWNALHLQIIYFCREFCPAKKHDETTCPICSKI